MQVMENLDLLNLKWKDQHLHPLEMCKPLWCVCVCVCVCSCIRVFVCAYVRHNVCRSVHACVCICVLVHKQMYWIRTNLRRFQPSNVFCNIRMLIFHYIMEYFGNLNSPCPLHEQPTDEIICTMQLYVCLTA